MGKEIATRHFTEDDFARYAERYDQEMAVLARWFAGKRFSRRRSIGGLELEAWLVDPQGNPLPANERFLERAHNPALVPELAKFNIEMNVDPQALAGKGLRVLEDRLDGTYRESVRVAASLGATVVAIGILPTVTDAALCPANMSALRRYAALNEQVLRLREGRPIRLDIVGRERLTSEHRDVMLEAGATSFQIHLQVPLADAVRYFNASMILSAPMVAVGATSPMLFGKVLWEETRIPLFEQGVDIGSPERRVTFGSDYAHGSLEECFRANRDYHPVLLPLVLDEPESRLAHVRLHNGTIWRWNRPIIGFDANGKPHLRVEHRVLPAGPTLIDMVANMAFFYGLVEWLARERVAPELKLPFSTAKQNFYEAARLGLAARIDWYDGGRWGIARLIQQVLLDQARKGLEALRVDGELIDRYLNVIEQRVATELTGAAWQRGFLERYGRDFAALTCAYRDRSASGTPVHAWDL
jgi:hypothetical protein